MKKIIYVCIFLIVISIFTGCNNNNDVEKFIDSIDSQIKDNIDTGLLHQSKANTAEYIISYSDKEKIDVSEVACMTPEQLELAYYEIYARHGVLFDYKILNGFFSSKSWYLGRIDYNSFDTNELSDIEKENLSILETWISTLMEKYNSNPDDISVGEIIWCESRAILYKSNDADISKVKCVIPQYSAMEFLGQEETTIKVNWNGEIGYINPNVDDMSYVFPTALYKTTWGTVINDDTKFVTATNDFIADEGTYYLISKGEKVRCIDKLYPYDIDYNIDDSYLAEYNGMTGYIKISDIQIENFSHDGYPIGIIFEAYKEDSFNEDILFGSVFPEDLKSLSTESLKEYPENREFYINSIKAKYGVYSEGYNSFSEYYNYYAPIVNEEDFNENILNDIEKTNMEILRNQREIDDYFYVDLNSWNGTFVADNGKILAFYDSTPESKRVWFHKDSLNEILDSGWVGLSVDTEHYKFANCGFYWIDDAYDITITFISSDELDVKINNGEDSWFVGHYKKDDNVSTDFIETLSQKELDEARSGVIHQNSWIGNYMSDVGNEMLISTANDLMFKCTITNGNKICENFGVVFYTGRRTANCEVRAEDGVFNLNFDFDGSQTITVTSNSGDCWMTGIYSK